MTRTLSLLLALLCFTFLAAAPAPLRAAEGATGVIRGRLAGGASARAGKLSFLLDGARRSARIQSGAFALRGVAAGQHTLSIVDRARNVGAHMQVEVRPLATTHVGAVALASGGQITGLVSRVVRRNGTVLEPLEGVEVVAESEVFINILPPPEPVRLVAITDADGSYRFRAVPPGAYRVSVVVPGLEAGAEFAFVELGRTAVADFLLREAIEEGVATVRGTVRDPEGEPLEGALVTVYSDGVVFPLSVSPASVVRARRLGKLARVQPRSLPRGAFSTLTDQEGQFSLNVPSGDSYFEVAADGYLPVSEFLTLHPCDVREMHVTLERFEEPIGASVEGRVVDGATGAPVVEARVVVDTGMNTRTHPQPSLFAVTDRHGYYRIEGIPAGRWVVRVEHPHYQPARETLEFGDGTAAALDFKLQPAGNTKKQ